MKVTRRFAAQAHEAGRKVAHEEHWNPRAFTKKLKDLHPAQQVGIIALIQWAMDNRHKLNKKRKK